MTMPPDDVIAAIGRLNQHARAWGCGRKAIYGCKGVVTIAAGEAGALQGRLIAWIGKCSACDGTGKHWEFGARCRRCSTTGKVRLQFLETTFPDGHVWHHPWQVNELGFVGWEIARSIWGIVEWAQDGSGGYYTPDPAWEGGIRPLSWEPAETWSPRLPAERLPIAELAPLLNTVESWMATSAAGGWLRSSALHQMARYRLDIGRADGPCCLCGAAPTHGLGFMPRELRLHWSRPVCDGHRDMHPRNWPQSLPEELVTPAIRTWLAHPARKEPPPRDGDDR